jgi:hypothetical protein
MTVAEHSAESLAAFDWVVKVTPYRRPRKIANLSPAAFLASLDFHVALLP